MIIFQCKFRVQFCDHRWDLQRHRPPFDFGPGKSRQAREIARINVSVMVISHDLVEVRNHSFVVDVISASGVNERNTRRALEILLDAEWRAISPPGGERNVLGHLDVQFDVDGSVFCTIRILLTNGAAPQKPKLVIRIHFKVQHHPRNLVFVEGHFCDVLYYCFVYILYLGRQESPTNRGGLAVDLVSLKRDGALVKTEPFVM
mmetsp:Transcript_33031/g.48422  ORF Transcript_33031/g.48422 Transcript_33031/m.48422 type:complete len:203 (-) Transcript_33031:16-624(-)